MTLLFYQTMICSEESYICSFFLILCLNTTSYKATISASRPNSHKMSSIFQSQSLQHMREIRTTRVIDQIALAGNTLLYFFKVNYTVVVCNRSII